MDAMQTPEWRLAGEVLRQAIADAQCLPGQAYLNVQDIDEARRFCSDAGGDWAEARGLWCDAANIPPDAFAPLASRAMRKADPA